MAVVGAVEVKVIVWLRFTEKACCTWGAALKVVLPAWLASRVQVPGPVKLTHAAVDRADTAAGRIDGDGHGQARGGGGRRRVGGATDARIAGRGRGEGDRLVGLVRFR